MAILLTQTRLKIRAWYKVLFPSVITEGRLSNYRNMLKLKLKELKDSLFKKFKENSGLCM